MGLTSGQMQLIEAIAENDSSHYRVLAVNCLKEDSTKQNQSFVRKYIEKLNISKIDIPHNLNDKLVCFDINSFQAGRYYLSENNKSIFDSIVKTAHVADKLNKMGINFKNTTLLYGLSDTGKTMFCRYVAYKLGLPLYYLNFSNLIDSYMGKTAQNINLIFNFVKQYDCMLLIDELDCIATKRKSGGQSGADAEIERITISIMQELDNLSNKTIVIGATNRLDIVDDALLRRFSNKKEFSPFSKKENIDMIKLFIENTHTESYFTEDEINDIIDKLTTQGSIITKLTQILVNKLYAEEKNL